MGHLKITTGHLSVTTGGHLGKCPACIDAPDLTICECLSADYGTIETPTVDVVFSDASICYYTGGLGPPCATVTGYDWTGTYSVVCTGSITQTIWSASTFICTKGGSDYYCGEALTIRLEVSGSTYTVNVSFSSSIGIRSAGDPDVGPYDSSAPNGGNTYIFTATKQNTRFVCTNIETTTENVRGCVTALAYSTEVNVAPSLGLAYCDHSDAVKSYYPISVDMV